VKIARKFAIAGGVTALVTGAAFAGVAVADIPNSRAGEITGCYTTSGGQVRVIDKESSAACHSYETEFSWPSDVTDPFEGKVTEPRNSTGTGAAWDQPDLTPTVHWDTTPWSTDYKLPLVEGEHVVGEGDIYKSLTFYPKSNNVAGLNPHEVTIDMEHHADIVVTFNGVATHSPRTVHLPYEEVLDITVSVS